MAEPDDEIPKINPSEVETLIKKIEQTTLSEQDKRMITRLLRTLLYVVGLLQEKKVTLLRLKEMVFGKKSEKMKRREGEKDEPKDEPVSTARSGAPASDANVRRAGLQLLWRERKNRLQVSGPRETEIRGDTKNLS